MRTVIFTGWILMLWTLVSCKSNQLEVFIVDKQESPGVTSFDFQGSMLSSNENLDEEARQALRTFRKANVIMYSVEANGTEQYEKDIAELKGILQSGGYESLMKYHSGKTGTSVYMSGDTGKVDEIIVLGKNPGKGWILVRLLGDDMNPALIIKALRKSGMESIIDNNKVKKLKGIMDEWDF